jgi:hypothetical protein
VDRIIEEEVVAWRTTRLRDAPFEVEPGQYATYEQESSVRIRLSALGSARLA